MSVYMVFKASMVLVFFLQLSFSSTLPGRTRRHVDGMFTSEFSRARGSAAIRKIINSALTGKRDIAENSYKVNTPDVNIQSDSPSLFGLPYKSALEASRLEESLNDVTDGQLCATIFDLLYSSLYPSQQQRRDQYY